MWILYNSKAKQTKIKSQVPNLIPGMIGTSSSDSSLESLLPFDSVHSGWASLLAWTSLIDPIILVMYWSFLNSSSFPKVHGFCSLMFKLLLWLASSSFSFFPTFVVSLVKWLLVYSLSCLPNTIKVPFLEELGLEMRVVSDGNKINWNVCGVKIGVSKWESDILGFPTEWMFEAFLREATLTTIWIPEGRTRLLWYTFRYQCSWKET